jgi:hypothetical protein
MKLDVKEWTGVIWLMTETRCRFFDHAIKSLGCIKSKKFPESLNDYQLLKKKPLPWSYVECYDKDRNHLESPQLVQENRCYTNLEAS